MFHVIIYSMKITGVILTKNEEKNIKRAIDSLDFCDEIIIIDDFSSDQTLEIIKKNKKIKFFQKKLDNDFASQRNFALKKSKNDWVFFLDADEEVTKELKKEILSIKDEFINKNNLGGFYIKRRDFFLGKELKYGEVKEKREIGVIRLLRKDAGVWQGKVHEKFFLKDKKLKTKTLKGFLNHYPHQTIKEFIAHLNFYSNLKAKELYEEGKRTNIFEIIFFPFLKFIYTYFLKFGFLDKEEGFIYSFLMSFHSFLVRAKLFQLAENKK